MRFDQADPVIERWGRLNTVPWCHAYRGEEVRSADFTLSDGTFAQPWLEPQEDGSIAVCAWDRRARKHNEIASWTNLESALDRALVVIRSWSPRVDAV